MTKLHSRDIMFRIHGHPLWAHPPNGQKNLGRSVSHIYGSSKRSKVHDWNPQWRQPDSLTPSGLTGGPTKEAGPPISIRWPSSTSPLTRHRQRWGESRSR
jgi:hypothetical protein